MNSKILNQLVNNYKNLPDQNDLVINKEWNLINEDDITLVIVGDNPGEKEKDNHQYFHSEGKAGGRAREFARQFLNIKKSDTISLKGVIFMNKTPFYSQRTNDLPNEKMSVIDESIDFTLNALNQFIDFDDIKIIVIGCCANKLNKVFFKKLKDSIYKKLREKIIFTKHFSYGNFDKQYNKFENKSKSINVILNEMNKETRERIKIYHHSDF